MHLCTLRNVLSRQISPYRSGAGPSVWFYIDGAGQDVTVTTCGGTTFDCDLTILKHGGGNYCGSFYNVNYLTNNCGPAGEQVEATWTADAGDRYYIILHSLAGESGSYDIEVTCATDVGPPNTSCATPQAMLCGQSFQGNLSQNASELWYSYYAVTNNAVTFSTCNGPNVDTEMWVYTDCNDITPLYYNDDGCASPAGGGSQIQFMASAGTWYYVKITGYNGGTGDFTLDFTCEGFSPPQNEECEDAEPISCPGYTNGSTQGASNNGQGTSPGVWYKVEQPSGRMIASLCGGADFDSKMDLYRTHSTLGGCHALLLVNTNDNYCGDDAQITWIAEQGMDYYIYVYGANANEDGHFVLEVTCDPGLAIPNMTCFGALSQGCDMDISITNDPNINVNWPPFFEFSAWYQTIGDGNPLTVELDCNISTTHGIRIFTAPENS
ncbi:MAG: hypothetical protein AAF570_24775, partial [Bacteroidota bacterium]